MYKLESHSIFFKYIQDLQDQLRWDDSFKRTQQKLVDAARRAKREMAEGDAQPMDYNLL